MEQEQMDRPAGEGADPFVTHVSLFNRLKTNLPQDRESAWEDFRAFYGPIIAGFARRCGASPQDVDDICQDVMAAFFSVSGEFAYDPNRGRFRGWLKTCTVRASLRRADRNLKFRGTPLQDVPEIELAVEPIWNDVWEQQLVSRALNSLRKSVGQSNVFRAFEQYVLLDRQADAVAADLKISVESVHQSKTRMTTRLRDLVGQLREAEA